MSMNCMACGEACESPSRFASATARVLCNVCVHPAETRTYCAGCKSRLTLTPDQVRELLELFATSLEIPSGSVMVYTKYCPLCRTSQPETFHQKVFSIQCLSE